jgi:hypothetical protein
MLQDSGVTVPEAVAVDVGIYLFLFILSTK